MGNALRRAGAKKEDEKKMNQMGIRARKRRQEIGLTQKDIAEAVGVERPYITQFEAGYKIPSVCVLTQIAEKLGVTLDYLVNGGDKKTKQKKEQTK